MRVAAGLESVAEGEPAVGRQVIRAFERAHAARRTDKALNSCWRAVGALIHGRRALAPSASTVGVHSLVADAVGKWLEPRQTVLVFGQGQIGKAVARALQRQSKFEAQV